MVQYKIQITINAEKEILSAYNFYEDQQISLGEKFLNELETSFKLIQKNPYLFARKHKAFREIVLNKFPFLIVYEINAEILIIISVFHTSKNPKKKENK